MKLHFIIGDREQEVSLEGDELRLGRAPDNDIVLPDYSVSRQHAILRRAGDQWQVLDMGSTNGVQIDGRSVQEHVVRPGERIKIGVFELWVEDETGAEAAAAIENATIVRRLDEFQTELSVDGVPASSGTVITTTGTEKEASFLSLLTRLARELLTADDQGTILRAVMDVAFEALPVDRGFILLGEPGGITTCELARFGERVEEHPTEDVPVSKTILETVMRQQVALLTLDARDDQRLLGGESIRIHGIRAAMCAPLWSEDGISGFMQVDTAFQSGSFTPDHLDFLIALANYAAVSIARLRERRLRGRLERYHSPAVVDEVLRDVASQGQESALRRAEVTVLFADLVGFTAYSETASPEDVAEMLGGYCTRAVDTIFGCGGTLDKFIGDCVMAFFGAPVQQDDHAQRGVRAGVGIQTAIAEWNRERAAAGLPAVRCRIGINTGPVVVGDVGSESRVDYTVLGNTVNVAARFESMLAQPGEVVIGEATRASLSDEFEIEPLGEHSLKGLQQKVGAFRVKLAS